MSSLSPQYVPSLQDAIGHVHFLPDMLTLYMMPLVMLTQQEGPHQMQHPNLESQTL